MFVLCRMGRLARRPRGEEAVTLQVWNRQRKHLCQTVNVSTIDAELSWSEEHRGSVQYSALQEEVEEEKKNF